VLYLLINTKIPFEKLILQFKASGGRVDKYYLQSWNRNKQALVYLKGWFSGKNIREALIKALSDQKTR